jgi:hypothetical protein
VNLAPRYGKTDVHPSVDLFHRTDLVNEVDDYQQVVDVRTLDS